MSRDGSIALDFGGETRTFRLAIGQLRALQEKCDAGPGEIAQRMAPFELYREERRLALERGVETPNLLLAVATGRLGSWRLDDIREPILQGLIGGGMDVPTATRLVKTWVDDRPKVESIPTAFAVCMAAIIGVEDEIPAGEPSGEGDGGSRPSPAAN